MQAESTFNDMEDVHAYRKRYELAIRLLRESDISQRNKQLIEKFCNDCFAQGIKAGRVQKYAYILRRVAEWLEKDFDVANEDDLKRVVALIHTSPFTEWTKHDYKRSIKKFFKWLGREKLVFWIKCTGPRNRKLPEEILTEEDIKKMIDAARNVRDRAIVAVLYESGCRAGEFLSMKIKNVSFDRYGAVAIVHGKTGYRRIRLVLSTPYLAEWLNSHPFRDDPEAWLWISLNSFKRIPYNSLRTILRNIAERAGVKKKVNPHAFRHARATHLAKFLTEAQMKEFFGWVQDSDMASVYVHLSGRDVDRAILQLYGMEVEDEREENGKLMPKKCLRCGEINPATNKVCRRCFFPLDENAERFLEKDVRREMIDVVIETLWNDREFREIFMKKVREVKALI
jgi:site-specific recombinase XerD